MKRLAILSLVSSLSLVSCEQKEGETVNLSDQGSRPGQHAARQADPELDLAIQQARSGNAEDQYALAKVYAERAREGKTSMDNVVEWTEKAAMQGHMEAIMTLGGMFLTGTEIPRNLEKSRGWFEKAAGLGNSEANMFLGSIYMMGDGIDRDVQRGWQYIERAAAAGLPAAIGAVGRAKWEGSNGMAHDEEEGLKMIEQAAGRGDTPSAILAGKIYYNGIGVDADPQQSFKWYSMAAAAGNAEAQFIVAMMYLEGEGVEENAVQAVNWLKLAAGQDHVSAMGVLSICYSAGRGTEVDNELARVWRERMQKLNDQRAKEMENGKKTING